MYRCPKCNRSVDLSKIPDAVLKSEWGRRSSARRVKPSGGSVWGHHNPKVKNCHCLACNTARAATAAQ